MKLQAEMKDDETKRRKLEEEEEEDEAKKKKEDEEANVKVIWAPVERQVECMEQKVIEKLHKKETTRVQPIVHRDRYQVEVHQIVQPIIEKVVKAPMVELKAPVHEELGARVEEATFVASAPSAPATTTVLSGPPAPIQSRSEVVSVEQRHEELPPIIEETVHRKIIERITPLILKEVVLPNLTLMEAFPEDVLTSEAGVHTQVGTPIVIERLVIRAGTESLEERLARLEAKAERKAAKRAAKELLKAERRASKLELKAQKRAAKAERKALKQVLREQELVVKAELAVKAQHEKQQQQHQSQPVVVVEHVPAAVPAVVVMDVDAGKDKAVEVVTTVDEAVIKTSETTTTPSVVVATLTDKTVAIEKLKNFSPMIVTRSDSAQKLKEQEQEQEEQAPLTRNQRKKQQQQQRRRASGVETRNGRASIETPEQAV
jgi:hypothetical protein